MTVQEYLPIQIEIMKKTIEKYEREIIDENKHYTKQFQILDLILDLEKEIKLAEEAIKDANIKRMLTRFHNFEYYLELFKELTTEV
jgi:hypothetical protein